MKHKEITIALIILVFLLALPLVQAVDYWDNAINLYPTTTTKWDGIREIQNGAFSTLDVTVTYYSSSNISIFKTYYLTGNGTTFIAVENGVVIKNQDTKRLQYNEKLVFDIEASPIDGVTQGQTASVTVQIRREEVTKGQGEITIYPNFDLLIISYPYYVVRLWTPETTFTIELKNKASVDVETKLMYWLENELNQTVYKETQTILMLKEETKTITVSVPTPADLGEYSFHAKVVDPRVIASAQKTFKVYGFLEWLLNEGSIFLFLLIAVPIGVFVGWATKEEKWSEWFE